jgi:glycosyltransferase involved in cell wall biosynthesis
LTNPVTHSLPSRPRADVSKKQFLYVGRLSPEKGPELACEAARQAGVPLVVMGEGPLRSQLQAAYPSVDFRGWSSPDAIFSQMLQSTALVFPSVCYETQGLVVAEALSVGLPVIVSDVTAAKELVDGENGLLYRSGDSGDLAKKMSELLADTERVEAMSRHAFAKYWETPFSFDKFVTDSLSLYERIREHDNQRS